MIRATSRQTFVVAAEMREWIAEKRALTPEELLRRSTKYLLLHFPTNSDVESAEWVSKRAFIQIAAELEDFTDYQLLEDAARDAV